MPVGWGEHAGPGPRTALLDYPPNGVDPVEALEETVAALREKGFQRAVGPMRGDTWHAYRLVTWTDGSDPFLLESPEMFADPEPWRRAGFAEADGYLSTRVPIEPDPRRERVERRLAGEGVVIRPFRVEDPEPELRGIHRLCLESFAGNAWYAPIPVEAFLELYLPLMGRVDPELALVAEAEERPRGFVLSAVDPRRNELVVKTLAVEPGRRFAGLGMALLDRAQSHAARGGAVHAIHALMHEANRSVNFSKDGGVIRRYHLFARDI